MLNQALQVLLLQRVHDIEKVVSRRETPLRQFVWEVLRENLVVINMGPKIDNTELIELWHVDHLDCAQGQQFLFACNYLARKILVAHQKWWCVPLDCTKGEIRQSILTLLTEVVQEIILALESVDEFSGQVALLAASPWIKPLAFLFNHKRYYLRM